MVLVDTSVWVDHLRRGNAPLAALLHDARVATHPYVIGELACGGIANRRELLSLLNSLPGADCADHHEVLSFIELHRLMGRGLGWLEVNLLASAALSGIPLWTLDKALAAAAARLGLSQV